MRSGLKFLQLATVTLLLSTIAPGFETMLAVAQSSQERRSQAIQLNNEGEKLRQQGQFAAALAKYQQALAIAQASGERQAQGAILNNIGATYTSLGQSAKALEFYQQALSFIKEAGDRRSEGAMLNNIGALYTGLGEYRQALEFYQQALTIRQKVGDRRGEGTTINNIGEVYIGLGQYANALEMYEQALVIRREVGDQVGETTTLNNIGSVYTRLGQYPKALAFYQQTLGLYKKIGNRLLEGTTLDHLGTIYTSLGQYPQALAFYQQALVIRQAVGDRPGEGKTLNNLGNVYERQGHYPQALETYQQALAIHREVQNRSLAGTTLNNLGLLYLNLQRYQQALESYQQALVILQAIGNRPAEGSTLNNLGGVYEKLGQHPQAIAAYEQALAIRREVGDRTGEGITLGNLGYLLASQNQPEVAIVFYKQAVNLTEAIRQELRVLPTAQQQSYLETVATNYRSLADLLLGLGRVLEAQQVMELLKVQELEQYTRDAQAGQPIGISLTPNEEKILKEHGTLIAFGQEVAECKQTRCQQLSQLNDQLDSITRQYNVNIASFAKAIRDRQSVDRATFDPRELGNIRKIVEAEPGTVLIYPFVLEDKIWLLWAAHGGIVKSVEVPVSQRRLGEAVVKFRRLVTDITASKTAIQAEGKQLYDWLLKPLEPELKSNQVAHLVFSLDRVTRYLPIAALFDGKQYLVENYTISTILSAGLTRMDDRLPADRKTISVLALGASEFKDLNPLPNVPAELDAIVRQPSNDTQGIYPGLKFLNRAFDFRSLRDNLTGRQVLHIATHADFVAGRPEDSFLMLGTGEKLAIPEIQTLQDLNGVHLVVLSACSTALGGADQDGVEISGLSSYFLNNGAAAVMASLWSVSDDSTRQLMQQFYAKLAQSTAQTPITKAAALRQAQLLLLRGQETSLHPDQRGIGIVGNTGDDRAAQNRDSSYAHPFFWAPFVLIGNGL